MSATFVLYCDWEDVINDLTDEEAGRLFKAIFAYVNNGIVNHFDKGTGISIAYKTMCKQIDVNRKKYEQVVEKRRNAANKRWKKSDEDMQSNAKNANAYFAMHNDNVNENDNDNVNDIVNENGNERNDNVNDNVSPSAPDFSAVELSDDQLSSLVSFSSQQIVDAFISKARQWQIKYKRRYKDPYKTILGWIQADKGKAKKKSTIYSPAACEKNQSFTVEQLERIVKNYGKGE